MCEFPPRAMPAAQKRLRFYYVFLGLYLGFQLILLSVLKGSNQNTHTNALKILEIYKKLVEKLKKHSVLDNSGLYKIIHVKKLNWKNSNDVSVVSQCSSNHFSQIERLFTAWEGPISVAVYSEAWNIERSVWDVARFIHCNSQRDFGMQLVAPTQDTYIQDFKFANDFLVDFDKSVSCSSPYASVLNEKKNYNWTSPYPVNLLRNVARSGTSTDHVLVIDVDMLPSPNLRSDFLNLTKSSGEKAVYVVPAFEVLPNKPLPQNKKKLLRMVESNFARPFYIVPCESCQKLTRYNDWLTTPDLPGMRVLYQVEWKHPWEPFFIGGRDVPNFDERFKQYGMNRVSQVCELHVAGFKFLVVDNAFLIHVGYKTPEKFHETKEKEMETNRRVYTRFKIEVRYKYPGSDRSC